MHNIGWVDTTISLYALFFYLDTINTQVHEATKHTPYELVFGQPPKSLLVPDATFKGKINEEELAEPSQEEENESIAEELEDHDRAEQGDRNREQGDHDRAGVLSVRRFYLLDSNKLFLLIQWVRGGHS